MSEQTTNMRFVYASVGTFLVAFPAMVLIYSMLF